MSRQTSEGARRRRARRRALAATGGLLVAGLAAGLVHVLVQPLPGLGIRAAEGQAAATAPAARAVSVVAAAARSAPIAREITVVGTLRSNRSVIVRPEIAGRVSDILFDDGETVAGGEPLVRLDSTVLEAQLEQARSTLELRRANAKRAGELLARGTGTMLARDEAEAALRADEAAVKLAESQLAKTIIYAPFGGTVGLKRIEVGDYVAPGQDIVNLEDIATLKVDFRVPEVFMAAVVVGRMARVESIAYPGQSFQAEVTAIDPAVDEAGRSLLVRATMANPRGKLRPGQFVQVSIPVEERPSATLVPEAAVVLQGGRTYVYRVENGKAVLTPVETGLRQASDVEIVSGIGPGTLVVTLGHEKLTDGAPVEIQPAPDPSTES